MAGVISHMIEENVKSRGISVVNETPVPLLVICSQLTPLHWGKVEPGATWNPDNVLGMGRGA
jgi:hypothetical protein